MDDTKFDVWWNKNGARWGRDIDGGMNPIHLAMEVWDGCINAMIEEMNKKNKLESK